MVKEVYLSLPVSDLKKSIAFYTALGFTFEPKFASDNSAAIILREHTFVMLMARGFYSTFTPKPIVDAHAYATMQIGIALESKEAVDKMVATARKMGGKAPQEPSDMGGMYNGDFEDPDGHPWGPMYAPQ